MVAAQDLEALEGAPVVVGVAGDADAGSVYSVTLFHLITSATRPWGGLLLTARTLPATWPAGAPILRSRLNALPVAELGEPDDAVLRALLERFFRERNIRPSDDLLPYLAHRIERSVAKARDIVARLDATADAQQRPITTAPARQILAAHAEGHELFE